MVAAGTPILLREPSRAAGRRRTPARLILAAVVAGVIVTALLAGPALVLGDRDHLAIVTAMRDGSNYYGLVAGIVPAGAFAGRLVPLPTLALVEAVAGPLAAAILLCAVLASILLVGWDRLGALFVDARARLIGAVLLTGGVAAGALLTVTEPHGGWVALLAAWSLLLRQRGRWVEAAALAAVAAVIDPAALVLTIVMAVAAVRDGERQEAAGWLVASLLGSLTWLAHRLALAGAGIAATGPGSPAAPLDVSIAALLPGAPPPLAAAALLLALVGWGMTRGALAQRTAGVAIAGLLIAHAPGMRSAATVATVLLPLGLVFAVEVLAVLTHAATDRRRITVTRMIR